MALCLAMLLGRETQHNIVFPFCWDRNRAWQEKPLVSSTPSSRLVQTENAFSCCHLKHLLPFFTGSAGNKPFSFKARSSCPHVSPIRVHFSSHVSSFLDPGRRQPQEYEFILSEEGCIRAQHSAGQLGTRLVLLCWEWEIEEPSACTSYSRCFKCFKNAYRLVHIKMDVDQTQ